MNAIDTGPISDVQALSELVPPANLSEARGQRDALTRLLAREREASADFLLALADFDRRRGWERLGHASLFAFLTRDLALSNGAAWLRLTAARLLPRFPEVESALRRGALCLSAVGEVSRVLTEANAADVLPRFFGKSSREAREVAAAILPVQAPPRRAMVTLQPAAARVLAKESPAVLALTTAEAQDPGALVPPACPQPAAPAARALRAHEVESTQPTRAEPPAVEPLSADLRRLHVTVSARFLEKVAHARRGLSHASPGASTEEVLEAALDLLLAQQARRKALVKRPRAAGAAAGTPAGTSSPRHVPAAVAREVRLRDGDRCQHPLDGGGVCGSTWRVQLDHVVPVALGGPATAANLRCLCATHNRRAAEQALGPGVAGLRRRAARTRVRTASDGLDASPCPAVK